MDIYVVSVFNHNKRSLNTHIIEYILWFHKYISQRSIIKPFNSAQVPAKKNSPP